MNLQCQDEGRKQSYVGFWTLLYDQLIRDYSQGKKTTIQRYKPQEQILEPKQHIQRKWLLHIHELDQTSSSAVFVDPLQRLCCQNED